VADVTFLPAAELEYQDALAWYAQRSQRAAAGFEGAVAAELERIAQAPESWPRCDDRHRFYVLRRYPYSIVYRMVGEKALVVAVAHASRAEACWRHR
jgi:plasmid stabilization system protein ParE